MGVDEAPQPLPEEERARSLPTNGPPFLFVDGTFGRDDLRALYLCPVSETLWVDGSLNKRRPFVSELLKRDTSGYNPGAP